MDIGERIIEIRKLKKISQEELASRIGITKSTVSGYETGRRNVPDRVITDICREYNVSEKWLVKGLGEIFIETPDKAIEQLKIEYDLSDLETILLDEYLKLSKEQRDSAMSYFTKVFGKLTKEKPAPVDELALTAEQAYEKTLLSAPKRGHTALSTTDDIGNIEKGRIAK